MYSLTLTVYQVMDLFVVSGSIRSHFDDHSVERVATFHDSMTLPDSWLSEDETATLIHVIEEWAKRTISD